MSRAVVSGAGSGMGRASAALFARRGWDVVGVDRDGTAVSAAAERDGFTPVAVDIVDRDGLDEIIGATGPIDAVVNAAGIYPPTTIDAYDEPTYRRIFDVNVLGTVNLIAACLPGLRAAGGGSVVNFASIDAFALSRGQLFYSASKAAVVALTRSLADELAADGVAVNAIAPGWVDTPGTRAGGRMEQAVVSIPAGRAAHPDEIAEWAWLLAHAPYTSGETVVVSGGLTVR